MTPCDRGAMTCRAFRVLKGLSGSFLADATGMWSYPALLKGRDGAFLWLCLILGTAYMNGRRRTALFRPKALVLARSGTAEIIRYESFREGHDPFPAYGWKSPVATFPHKAVGGLTVREFEALEDELLSGYWDAERSFADGLPLSDRFRGLYLRLQHPVMLGFLRPFASSFVASLGICGDGSPSGPLDLQGVGQEHAADSCEEQGEQA